MPSDEILVKEASELSLEDLKNVKRMLDERSGAHCLAKWYQVTLNLHNGRSASCCLQPSKPLELEAIKQDITQIHNGDAHVEERVSLRQGKKIASCSACWNVEKDGQYSERHFKSADSWAIEKIPDSDGDPRHISPTYVEVSFSTQCQLRCSYCNPDTSSSIAKEIEQNGAYPDRYTLMGIQERRDRGVLPISEHSDSSNPYVQAFWKWLPTVYEGLKVLRVTGGEPFLSEDTFKFMDYVKDNPNPNMAIEFNSNLSFPSAVFKRFEKAFSLIPRENYKTTTLYVSLDCWGERAEYIRFGMRIKEIEKNIERLLSQFPQMRLTITSTISVLGIQTFDDLLTKVLELKAKWGANRISLTAYPLVFPPFQTVALASQPLKAELQRVEAKAISTKKFSVRETQMIGAIASSAKQEINKDLLKKLKIDFYRFFKTYDERKKTSLVSLFPEHHELYEQGHKLSDLEKNIWLKQVHSENSKEAVIAIQHLMRAYPDDDNTEYELVHRLTSKDDLTYQYLTTKKSFTPKSLKLIQHGILSEKRANDLIRLMSTNSFLKSKMLEVFSLSNLSAKNFNSAILHIWNKSAVDYNVDVETWACVLSSLYISCKTTGRLNELISSTSNLSHDYIDKLDVPDSTIHSSFFKRTMIKSEDCFNSLFKPENTALLEFLPIYLSAIPVDPILAKALIRAAKQNKQHAGQIANGLSTWRGKLNACLSELKGGDAYVNALIAKHIGLDIQLAQTLVGLTDDEISNHLAQWIEASLTIDSSILASILFERSLAEEIPYKWLDHCKIITNETKLLNNLLNEYVTSNAQMTPEQIKLFFDLIKNFDCSPNRTLLSQFFASASESTFYSFIQYAKEIGAESELIEDYLLRVHSSTESERSSLFFNMLVEQSVLVELKSHLCALFSSSHSQWGLWELIVKKSEPNKLIKTALEILNSDLKIYKKVDHAYFKYLFDNVSHRLDLSLISSQIIPYWWVGLLVDSSIVTNEVVWSGLLSVKNDDEYWSVRPYVEQMSSLEFELKSIRDISLGDDAKYDLVCLLLEKTNVQNSIVDIYSAVLSNLGSKYIWSILERINKNDVEIKNLGFFVQAFVQSNLTDESYYSHIITILDKISLKRGVDQDLINDWIMFNAIFIDALNIMDTSKREWVLNQFLDANFFNPNFWSLDLFVELDRIDSNLLLLFSEKTNLSDKVFFNKLLEMLPLTSILASRYSTTDQFISKLNVLSEGEGFYCLQLRSECSLRLDWTVEQVLNMNVTFQDEFYRLLKSSFSSQWWLEVASASTQATMITALYLKTKDFLPTINNNENYHLYLIELHAKNTDSNLITPSLLDNFCEIESEKDKEIVSCLLSNLPVCNELYQIYQSSNHVIADILEQVYLEHESLSNTLLRDILLRYIYSSESERIIFRIQHFSFNEMNSFAFSDEDIKKLIQNNLIFRAVKIVNHLGLHSYALDLSLTYAIESESLIVTRLAPLYYLCESDIFRKVNAVEKIIAALCLLPYQSQICWNLVDIIIDHKLDRAIGYKRFITSSLVQRVKPERPFLKLLAYFKGIVHSSADM